uniref:DUF38 domain-containing protein n=1 Tax=Panagrolaimus sp. JU765 TaxID=591449 RepID=A0AC34Q9I3_9BILA
MDTQDMDLDAKREYNRQGILQLIKHCDFNLAIQLSGVNHDFRDAIFRPELRKVYANEILLETDNVSNTKISFATANGTKTFKNLYSDVEKLDLTTLGKIFHFKEMFPDSAVMEIKGLEIDVNFLVNFFAFLNNITYNLRNPRKRILWRMTFTNCNFSKLSTDLCVRFFDGLIELNCMCLTFNQEPHNFPKLCEILANIKLYLFPIFSIKSRIPEQDSLPFHNVVEALANNSARARTIVFNIEDIDLPRAVIERAVLGFCVPKMLQWRPNITKPMLYRFKTAHSQADYGQIIEKMYTSLIMFPYLPDWYFMIGCDGYVFTNNPSQISPNRVNEDMKIIKEYQVERNKSCAKPDKCTRFHGNQKILSTIK